jgi:hypothetical protein
MALRIAGTPDQTESPAIDIKIDRWSQHQFVVPPEFPLIVRANDVGSPVADRFSSQSIRRVLIVRVISARRQIDHIAA